MTPAERIAELEEQVAYYRSILGERVDEDRVRLLRKVLNIPPAVAKLALSLYGAKGRYVSHLTLEDLVKKDEHRDYALGTNIVGVYVHRLNVTLGPGSVRNDRGVGYAMTEAGRTKLDAILAAVDQLQAALS